MTKAADPCSSSRREMLPVILLIRYFVDPPDRFLLFYLEPDYQLYFSQRNISGSVGRLPYIRMPTR